MTNERLMYAQVVEGIFLKGVGAQLTPELKAEVKAAGINLDRLEPAYPVVTVERACKAIIPALYPGLSEGDAQFELGKASLRGYTETLMGRALIHVLKVIGVRRALLRMHLSMRSGNNFLETSSSVVGPTCVELHFSDVHGMPRFYEGIIQEGSRLAHAKRVQLEPLESVPPGHTVRVSWEE